MLELKVYEWIFRTQHIPLFQVPKVGLGAEPELVLLYSHCVPWDGMTAVLTPAVVQ